MILQAFSIHDSKAKSFNPPFYKHTPGEAERDFTELTRDEKSLISKYPEDYTLFMVGEYDTSTGQFRPMDAPKSLVNAAQLRAQ